MTLRPHQRSDLKTSHIVRHSVAYGGEFVLAYECVKQALVCHPLETFREFYPEAYASCSAQSLAVDAHVAAISLTPPHTQCQTRFAPV